MCVVVGIRTFRAAPAVTLPCQSPVSWEEKSPIKQVSTLDESGCGRISQIRINNSGALAISLLQAGTRGSQVTLKKPNMGCGVIICDFVVARRITV